MKLIVAGGRDFNDEELFRKTLLEYDLESIEIVSGLARGADTLGKTYAELWGLPFKEFPAEWNKYGKSAGYRRNVDMAEYADALLAFWDGKSKGTKHMIDIAKERNLATRIVLYE